MFASVRRHKLPYRDDTCHILMNVSSLGWGKLVEQCGTGPYRSSSEELPLHIHGQLSDEHNKKRLYLFQPLNKGLVVLIAHFFDV